MKKVNEKLKNRAIEIDVIRAVAVLLMVFDHAVNDISDIMPYVFSDFPKGDFWTTLVSKCASYWYWDFRVVMHFVVCFLFLAVTGICSSFTRSNLKRGLKLGAVSICLTLVTFIGAKICDNMDFLITFGVLHCISLTLIILGVIEKFIKNKWFYLVIGLIFVGVGIWAEIKSVVYSYGMENLAIIILRQIVGTAYFGGDNFGFFLNGGQIFVGVFLGKQFYGNKKSLFGFEYKNNFLTFIGRNSLIAYVLHQVIVIALFIIILLICGFHLDLPF